MKDPIDIQSRRGLYADEGTLHTLCIIIPLILYRVITWSRQEIWLLGVQNWSIMSEI